MSFDEISKVAKINDEELVNTMLRDGWVLKDILRVGSNYQYLLVKEG